MSDEKQPGACPHTYTDGNLAWGCVLPPGHNGHHSPFAMYSPQLAVRMYSALQVIAEALKEPDGGDYWPARKFLDKYGLYHDDLEGSRVLLRVAEVALGRIDPKQSNNPEKE